MGWCVRYACQRDAFTMEMDGCTTGRNRGVDSEGGKYGNIESEHVIGK